MNTIQNTLFIGKVHHQLAKIDSTNSFALNLLSEGNPPEGTIVSTYHQVQGRGQMGTKWLTKPGKNIALSIILHPHFLDIRRQFRLNQAISLGVLDFITSKQVNNCKVKWPNDIYINEYKVAGILIQNQVAGNKISACVVGIGINVNQTEFNPDIANPTSLQLETGLNYELDQLVAELCKAIEARYIQLRQNKFEQLQMDYINALYFFETPSYFQTDKGRIFHGQIIGLNDNGRLRIAHDNTEEDFGIKEIRFL